MSRLFRIFLLVCFTFVGFSFSEDENQQEASKNLGIYFGGFGGWGYLNKDSVTQTGTAFFSDENGGPLYVEAKGHSNSNSFGFGGLHIGYEWLPDVASKRKFIPAVELEGYYTAFTRKANLDNQTDRLDFHLFTDTFPMRIGTLLANALLSYDSSCIVPYIGIGIGTGILSIHNAYSKQTDPLEEGINHFNSDTKALSWVFATQAKAGLRYVLAKYCRLFAEYRFLYLCSSDYSFGSTQYPTHVRTSRWKVDFSGMCQNMFAIGLDFTL